MLRSDGPGDPSYVGSETGMETRLTLGVRRAWRLSGLSGDTGDLFRGHSTCYCWSINKLMASSSCSLRGLAILSFPCLSIRYLDGQVSTANAVAV